MNKPVIVSKCCGVEVQPSAEIGEDGITHWDVVCPECGKSCEYEQA